MNEERKITNDVLHKEIDLIQACITRMAHNSFLIKGWTITLVAVVLALAEKVTNPVPLCFVILVPLLSFWWLDTFFLRTERMYREMYKWVLKKRAEGSDEMLYDLDPRRFKDEVDSRAKTMRSETLRWFYGIPVAIVVVVMLFHIGVKCPSKKCEHNEKPTPEKSASIEAAKHSGKQ